MNIYDMFVEPASDCAQADDAVLSYSMCVNKVLHMQRAFLTEREQDDKNKLSTTMPTSPPAEATEDNAACSLQTMDTASTDLSAPPTAESDEVTLPSQTEPVHQMDLSS